MACPWANGVLTVMYLKGLDHVFSVSTTAPVWGLVNEEGRKGWVFDAKENCEQAQAIDHVNGFDSIAQIYWKHQPDYNDKFTVPLV